MKTVLQFRLNPPAQPRRFQNQPQMPSKSILPQFPLIVQDLALAFQLPTQMLNKDVPYVEIIEVLFSTQRLETLPGFPVPIPGIVILTAGPIFPAAIDFDLLKILAENMPVILEEFFQHTGLIPIRPRFFSSIGKIKPT
jgi:hypothetical protein